MRPWPVLPTWIFIAVTTAAPARAAQTDKIDNYVEAEMRRQHIPGVALGVYREGKVIKAQGYGFSNVELGVPVKPETVFQSGSVGKQFTATAVMMLVEEGKAGLDDSITKYFPDAPAPWRNIKVRNLLSHTSGLKDYTSGEVTKPGGQLNYRVDYTEDQLVKVIESFPTEYSPGDKWDYCNSNYLLLGVLIHKVTGKFYGDFLQERVFGLLGMNATRIISEADIIFNRAAGYQMLQRHLKNQDWVAPAFNTTADGAMYFNVLDLAKWDAALYTEQLLKKSSFQRMWTIFKLNDGKPNPSNYGFAWDVDQINGHRVLEHGGAWQGFTTYIARYVDDKLTVVVLTNLDSQHSRPSTIAHAVAGLYDPTLAVPELKPIDDKEPEVTRLLRSLIDDVAAGKAKPDSFTTDQAAELPDKLAGLRDDLQALGPMKSLQLVERKEDHNKRAYKYRGTFNDWTVLFDLALTPENKIAAFSVSPD